MPAKKRIKYWKGQVVEVGNGKKQKPLIGEVLDANRTYRYTQARGRGGWPREVRSSVITYHIHFFDGTQKWVYQEKILRVQPDPTQDELEARARELYGEDYI